MPKKHAYLPASSAYRWMKCTRSPAMCEGLEARASPYAQEGSDAHTLCEYKVLKALGRDADDPTENLDYFDQEMADCSDDYTSFSMEQVAEAGTHCPDPLILVEERLDFSRWVPEAFGTGDLVIVADDVLTIVDFKYGVGVVVEAEDNPQMRCYALGAWDAYGCLYDIKTVRMCIFQPRRDNISISEISIDDLLAWADGELAPKARQAFNGEGDLVAGDHCIFCAAKAVCRARAEKNLELAEYELEEADKLEPSEIAAILPRIDELVSWASDVKDFALSQAIAGVKYPGFKVVEGRSVRKYTDEDAVAKAVQDAGYDPYDRKVMGITALTKLLGKKRFEELLSDLVCKPHGRPVLAPESDKRPEYNSIDEAFSDN
ncbi:MAG: DUF2800 domain-containing protein [Lachnospiraceae bacterium]|nr:DUF2800 domain-containing protein [Lachnospiraceae bacterium]